MIELILWGDVSCKYGGLEVFTYFLERFLICLQTYVCVYIYIYTDAAIIAIM